MASSDQRIARRIPKIVHETVRTTHVARDKKDKVIPRFCTENTRVVPKGAYDYGIYQSSSLSGHRTLVAIIEDATYADAAQFLKSERTVGGHSVKGFKKLKPA